MISALIYMRKTRSKYQGRENVSGWLVVVIATASFAVADSPLSTDGGIDCVLNKTLPSLRHAIFGVTKQIFVP